jgi:hypothetical protein
MKDRSVLFSSESIDNPSSRKDLKSISLIATNLSVPSELFNTNNDFTMISGIVLQAQKGSYRNL